MFSLLARHTLLLSAVALSYLSTSSAQTCYNQDDSVDASGVPCYPSNTTGTSQSFCCDVGRQCYTNGLCGPSNTDPNYGRLSCTDPTWRSPNCPQFCLSNDASGGAVVVLCPGTDNQYCCSNLERDGTTYGCCDNSSNFLALGGLVEVDNGTAVSSTSATPSSTSSSFSITAHASTSTVASTPVTTSTAAAAATSSTTSSASGHSSSAAIGGGVGAAIFVVLIISVGLFFWMKRRKTRQAPNGLHSYPIVKLGTPYRAEADAGYARNVKHEIGNNEVKGARSPGGEWRGERAELG